MSLSKYENFVAASLFERKHTWLWNTVSYPVLSHTDLGATITATLNQAHTWTHYFCSLFWNIKSNLWRLSKYTLTQHSKTQTSLLTDKHSQSLCAHKRRTLSWFPALFIHIPMCHAVMSKGSMHASCQMFRGLTRFYLPNAWLKLTDTKLPFAFLFLCEKCELFGERYGVFLYSYQQSKFYELHSYF